MDIISQNVEGGTDVLSAAESLSAARTHDFQDRTDTTCNVLTWWYAITSWRHKHISQLCRLDQRMAAAQEQWVQTEISRSASPGRSLCAVFPGAFLAVCAGTGIVAKTAQTLGGYTTSICLSLSTPGMHTALRRKVLNWAPGYPTCLDSIAYLLQGIRKCAEVLAGVDASLVGLKL